MGVSHDVLRKKSKERRGGLWGGEKTLDTLREIEKERVYIESLREIERKKEYRVS
jgi:hypothetical protein